MTSTAISAAPSRRLLGIALVLVSSAMFAMAGTFTKMIDADAWVISGWRGAVSAILLFGYIVWRHRRTGCPLVLRLDSRGWIVAALSASASVSYIASFKNTYVANVAVIYALSPLVAALLGRLVLAEPVRRLTIVTSIISFGGVAVIAASGMGTGHLLGDSLAVLMTVLFALYVVSVRAYHDVPILWAVTVSALGLHLLSWIVSDPMAISSRDLGVALLFGASFTIAVILFTEGARMLPVAETALLSTTDVPLAAGFAWVMLAEAPPLATFFGGAIIMAAMIVQALGDLTASRWQSWRLVRDRRGSSGGSDGQGVTPRIDAKGIKVD